MQPDKPYMASDDESAADSEQSTTVEAKGSHPPHELANQAPIGSSYHDAVSANLYHSSALPYSGDAAEDISYASPTLNMPAAAGVHGTAPAAPTSPLRPVYKGGAPRRFPPVATATCPHCGKFFSGDRSTSGVFSNYRRHLLTHTGEKPFLCPYCSTGFTTRQNMRRHVRALHQQLVTPSKGPQSALHSPAAAPSQPPAKVMKGSRGAKPTAASFSEGGGSEDSQVGAHRRPSQRPPPPFALPTSTAITATAAAADNVTNRASANGGNAPLQCHYCRRYFAWRATHALHERTCRNTLHSCPESDAHSSSAAASSRSSSEQSMRSKATHPQVGEDDLPKASLPSEARPQKQARATCAREGMTGPARHSSPSLFPHPPPTQRLVAVQQATAAYVCPDCELELSNKGGLRRHQRYYCPFREDAFADPLADAVREPRKETTGGQRHRGKGDKGKKRQNGYRHTDDGSTSSSEGCCESHLAERRHAARLAATTGQKLYDNPNESYSDLDLLEDNESDSNSDSDGIGGGRRRRRCRLAAGDSDHEWERLFRSSDETGDESIASSEGGLFNGLTATVRESNRHVSLGRDDSLEGSDDEDGTLAGTDGCGAWLEDRLHLDFHRRRANRRRTRRILLRRLRAQERHRDLAETAGEATTVRATTTSHTESALRPAAASMNDKDRADPQVPVASVPQSSSSPSQAETTVTGSRSAAATAATVNAARPSALPPPRSQAARSMSALRQRALAIVEARYARGRGQRYTCPYDGCVQLFVSRRNWLVHVQRAHPQAYTKSMSASGDSRDVGGEGDEREKDR